MSDFFKELILPPLIGLVAIALFVLFLLGLVWVFSVISPLVLVIIGLAIGAFHIGDAILQEFQ